MSTIQKIQGALVALKIFDPDNKLSLTSILLMVAIARLALFPADAYSLGILTLALAHANAKRFAQHKAKEKTLADADKLTTLQSQVSGLISAANMQQTFKR